MDKCVGSEFYKEIYQGMMVARMIGACQSRKQLNEYEKSLLKN